MRHHDLTCARNDSGAMIRSQGATSLATRDVVYVGRRDVHASSPIGWISVWIILGTNCSLRCAAMQIYQDWKTNNKHLDSTVNPNKQANVSRPSAHTHVYIYIYIYTLSVPK